LVQRIAVDANASWLRLMTSVRRAKVILAAALTANSFAGTPARAGAPVSPIAAADLTHWQSALAAHLRKYMRYPADRRGQDATVVVTFRLERTGHVASAEISKSSGDAVFDDAALDMVRRADPVPAPPSVVTETGLLFQLPVSFKSP
jgi:TonB family protein